MRISSSFVATLAGATLMLSFGCGKNTAPQVAPNPPPVGNGHARLVIFGAGYCTICKVRFPEIQAELNRLNATERGKITVDMYLTAGDPASVRPTDEMAVAYSKQLGVNASSRADMWRWQTFRQLISNKFEVPAAAILDANGNIHRVFTAGDTTFVPQEIVAVAKEVAAMEVKP